LDDSRHKLGKSRASLSATNADHGTRHCRQTNDASGKTSPAVPQPGREWQVSHRRWSYGSPADLLSGTKIFRKMRKANQSGNCLVGITVDTDGKTKDAHFIKSTPDAKTEEQSDFALDMQDICIDTVQQYRFAPAMYQVKPVPVNLNVEINFQRSAPRS
jgi:outer membrane biosynthesis protein TonB